MCTMTLHLTLGLQTQPRCSHLPVPPRGTPWTTLGWWLHAALLSIRLFSGPFKKTSSTNLTQLTSHMNTLFQTEASPLLLEGPCHPPRPQAPGSARCARHWLPREPSLQSSRHFPRATWEPGSDSRTHAPTCKVTLPPTVTISRAGGGCTSPVCRPLPLG